MSDRRSYKNESKDRYSDKHDSDRKGGSRGKSGDDVLTGGSGSDHLNGGNGNDLIHGNGGIDKLDGGAGDDTLVGGADGDKLKGESGNDLLQGEDGHDHLDGGSGNDSLSGGEGWDVLDGGSGNDLLAGGGGNDYLDGGSGFDTATFSGSIADYQLLGDRDGRHDDWLIVRDLRDGSPDGIDLVRKVEALQFADGIIYLDGRNNAPVAGDDRAPALEDNSLTIPVASLLGNDRDFDGDRLRVTEVGNAVNGTVQLDGHGNVVFTPDPNFSGEASFIYTVSDGRGGTDQGLVRVDVAPVNDDPVAAADAYDAGEDDMLVVAAPGVLANDTDVDGDALSVASTGPLTSALGATVVLNGDGSFSYDAASSAVLQALNHGESRADTFSYEVADGEGGTATQTVTIRVAGADEDGNRAPAAFDDSFATTEDGRFNGDVLANDTDPESDPLTVTAVTAAQIVGGPVLPASVVNMQPNGQFQFAPDTSTALQELAAGQTADVTFDYTVSDGSLADTGTVTVRVTGLNDAPVVTTSIEFNLTEDGPDFQIRLSGDDRDSDDDGDSLIYSIVAQPEVGNVALVGDGPFAVYSGLSDFDGLAEGETREIAFTYQATDSHGAVSGAGAVNITVTGINDAPIAADDSLSIDAVVPQGDNPTLGAGNVIHNDFDIDADPLTVVPLVPGADVLYSTAYGDLRLGLSGQLDLVIGTEAGPGGAPSGADLLRMLSHTELVTVSTDLDSDPIEYTLTDGAATGTAGIVVTIQGVNDAPDAFDASYTTSENTPLVVGAFLAGHTFDWDHADVISLVNFDGAVHGSAVLNADGALVYTPDEGYFGDDSFTFTVADLLGETATATVSITVRHENSPPVAADDHFMVEGTLIPDVPTFLGNVLDNDDDANGDGLVILPRVEGELVNLYDTAYGDLSLDLESGQLTLTIAEPGPDAERYLQLAEGEIAVVATEEGGSPLGYTVSDGLDTASAGLSFELTGANDAPVVQEGFGFTAQGTPLVISAFLDTYAFDWDNGDSIELTDLQGFGGTVTLDDATGDVTYTPLDGFFGDDLFTYSVTDSFGLVSDGLFFVTVLPLDGLPADLPV